jgi:hypothetical protein
VSVTVSDADWAALVGSVLKEDTGELTTVFDRVDNQNDLTRYYLYIKWQEGGARRPGPNDPITDWPPWLFQWFVQYERFTREFVDDFLEREAINPIYVLVTDDPSGEVGWYTLDEFF